MKIKNVLKITSLLLVFAHPLFAEDLEAELTSKIQLLEEVIEAETANIDSLQKRYFSLLKEKKNLTNQVDTLKDKLNENKYTIKELKADLKKAPKKEIVYKSSPQQDKEIEKLNTQLNDRDQQVKSLKVELAEQKKIAKEAKTQLDKLSSDKIATENKLERLGDNLEFALNEKRDLLVELQSKSKEIGNLKKDLASQVRQTESSRDKIAKYSGSKSEIENNLDEVNSNLKIALKEKEEIAIKADSLQNQVQKLKSQLAEKEKSAKDAHERLKQATGDESSLAESLKKLDNELKEVSAQRVKLSAQLQDKDSEISSLRAQLRVKSEALEGARIASEQTGSIEGELKESREYTQKLLQEKEELVAKLSEKEGEAKELQLQQQGANFKKELKKAEEKINDLVKEKARLTTELESRNDEVTDLIAIAKKEKEAAKRVENKLNDFSGQENGFKEKLAAANKEINTLVRQKRRISDNLDNKEKEIEKLHTKLAEKDNVVQRIEGKLAASSGSEADLKKQLKKAEFDKKAASRQFEEKKISQIISVHEERIKKLGDQLDKKNDELKQVKSDLAIEKKGDTKEAREIKRLLKEIKLKNKEIERLMISIEYAVEYIEKSFPTGSDSKIGDPKQIVAIHKAKIVAMVKEAMLKDAENTSLQKKMDKQTEKLDTRVRSKKELIEEVEYKTKEIEKLKAIIKSAIARIELLSSAK
ncbi:MAG: hypothetical protein GY858_02180 [Candidatus Omnitrophica bacterium]|nr:hypothetical protein [Candidatus Omnitrophota bacterium]